jgi:hypothetical protein
MNSPTESCAICLNDGDDLSVRKAKVYRVLQPEPNDPDSMVRVVDEMAEDYLYPRSWFYVLKLPEEVTRTLWSSDDHG